LTATTVPLPHPHMCHLTLKMPPATVPPLHMHRQSCERVELIPGTGVYVTLPQLEEARREAKNGTQLARKLMDAFWDRETLARSSLSS
jgi:hypothetical protein